jgi:hypothetical protein
MTERIIRFRNEPSSEVDRSALSPRALAKYDAETANPELAKAIAWLGNSTAASRLNALERYELLAAMAKGGFTITFNGKPLIP